MRFSPSLLRLLPVLLVPAVVLLSGCSGPGAEQKAVPPLPPSSAPAGAAPATATRTSSTVAPAAHTAQTPAPAAHTPVPGSPAATSQPRSTSAGNAAPSGALFLEVTSPAEDMAVDAPTLQVQGRTIPGAVVSVGPELAPVKSDGSFTLELRLAEGPNDIEVVASDAVGNERSVIRSILYEP